MDWSQFDGNGPCDMEGQVPLAEELAFHLDVLGAGLAEPERSMP
jgi:hypothetical protein